MMSPVLKFIGLLMAWLAGLLIGGLFMPWLAVLLIILFFVVWMYLAYVKKEVLLVESHNAPGAGASRQDG